MECKKLSGFLQWKEWRFGIRLLLNEKLFWKDDDDFLLFSSNVAFYHIPPLFGYYGNMNWVKDYTN